MDSEHAEEFTDFEDLKTNYNVLKNQRDTYKLLLSNYEKIFLQDEFNRKEDIAEEISETSKPKELIDSLEDLTYTSFEKEIKIKSDKNEKNKTNSKIDSENKENNISDKIEQLNLEINELKTIFEKKNDSLHLANSDDKDNYINCFQKTFSYMLLKKISNSNKTSPEKFILAISPEKNILEKNLHKTGSYDHLSYNLEDDEKSNDSTSQMQNFFNNMADKLKVLEERNETLNNQVQVDIKEKENMLKKIQDLQIEIFKLNKQSEEKHKSTIKNQIEYLLEEQEKTINKKSNICKNVCIIF